MAEDKLRRPRSGSYRTKRAEFRAWITYELRQRGETFTHARAPWDEIRAALERRLGPRT